MKPDAFPGSGKPRFIVIGAGVGGICSALDLAEAGHPVTLVEQGPSTGGILPQLDHQFPDDHCGMCRMLPMVDRDGGEQTCLKRGLFHENIRILTRTTLTDLKGRPGDYTAQLTRVSRGIDSRRCSGCMACVDACPVEAPDAFNDRAGRRKAVYRPLFGNPEGLPTIDWENCTRCGACLAACPNQAVDLAPAEVVFSLAPVAGVILACGNRLYDPAATDLYGYGVLPNVVTATAFERILSGSGPYGGRPGRPSDGKPIHRVGWIQCVGSRNVMIGAGHCSSACCMIAVKEAMLAKRILGPQIHAAIFHMDMRTYGRDDQRYRDRAEEQAGVRFIRCRIHSVDPSDDPGDVKLTYLDAQNRVCEEVFGLVVLSTGAGVQPAPAPFLAEPAEQGAAVAVGLQAGLQNIRETVVQAHGAAGSLLIKTSQARYAPGTGPADGTTKRAEDRFKERPLIQILLLENVAVKKPEVDWPEIQSQLEAWASPLPVERLSVLEERDPWVDLAALLKTSVANRLLIVSSVVGGYREALGKRIAEAGFSDPLVAWVDLNRAGFSSGKRVIPTADALAMIRAAWMRLLHKRPLRGDAQGVEQRALVIGAGPAGLSAALSLAEKGVSVEVVEKKPDMGGNGLRVQEEETRHAVQALMTDAKDHPLIAIHTETTLAALSGRPGCFEGRLVTGDRQRATAFGAVIIATGGTTAATDAYGLGRHWRVVSHFDFEERTLAPRFAHDPLQRVVMIQCAGSREEPRNYCSRTCCVKSLQTALRVRRLFPKARIVVFYRDIMTPGLNEALYAQARSRGIRFIPFEKQAPPEVRTEEDRVIVNGFDPVMGEAIRLEADWVSLAVGMAPSPVSELCRILSVPLTPDGFVEEADAKWRPVDTINPGIFVCGLARGPLPVREAVAEGRAAALRALRLFKRNALVPQRGGAVVRHALCSRCYLCLDACPYGARYVETVSGKVAVDPAACQGCGSCASVCPNSATVIGDYEDFTVMGVIEAALG